MENKSSRLKTFANITKEKAKEKFFRYHNHAVELTVVGVLKGHSAFFKPQVFSNKKKTAKLRHDTIDDCWRLWAPRSFLISKICGVTTVKATRYRWSILDRAIAEKVMKQKRAKEKVIAITMTVDQLLQKHSKKVIFQ